MNVALYGNRLFADKHELTLSNSPDELRTILDIGHTAILEGIEIFYAQTKLRNPGAIVVRPSVYVMRLGTNSQSKRILTEKGRYNKRSTITDREELKPKYHPYWDAISESNFVPEVRGNLGGPLLGGIWLMLRALESESQDEL